MFQNIANGFNEKDSHYKDVKLKNEEIEKNMCYFGNYIEENR